MNTPVSSDRANLTQGHDSSSIGTERSGDATRMDPLVKAQWVAALRSGEYRQAQRQLRDGLESFCCLGVLCDLFDRNGWGSEFLSSAGTPPLSVRTWAGFPTDGEDDGCRPTPFVTINGAYMALYGHNDKGRTFAEIADAIEAQL